MHQDFAGCILSIIRKSEESSGTVCIRMLAPVHVKLRVPFFKLSMLQQNDGEESSGFYRSWENPSEIHSAAFAVSARNRPLVIRTVAAE